MKKISKKIGVIALIIVLISIIGSMATQVFSATYVIGAYKPYYNKALDRYRVNQSVVWKLGKYATTTSADNSIDYTDAIYCLDLARGFQSPVTEKVQYDVFNPTDADYLDVRDPADFAKIFPSLDASKVQRQILWILDNMFIKGNTESKTKLLDAAYKEKGSNLTSNFSYLRGTKPELSVARGEDVIEIVQQYAMWHFTNNFNDDSLNIELNGAEMPWNWANNDEATVLYKYLIESAEKYKDTYKLNSSTNTYETPISIKLSEITANASIQEIGGASYFVAGPFQYEESTGTYNITKYEVIDGSGNVVPGGRILDNGTLKDPASYTKAPKQDIFVAVPVVGTSITKLGLRINYSYYRFSGQFLTKKGQESSTQPIIIVKKDLVPGTDSKTVDLNINTKFGIKLTKVDENNTATKIPGAKFELKNTKTGEKTELTTDSNGLINFANIAVPVPAGTYNYTLTEKDPAPNGWILNSNPISLDITFNANGKITSVTKASGSNATITSPTGAGEFVEIGLTVTNIRSYGFELIKQNSVTPYERLNGALFDIEAKTDKGVILRTVTNGETTGTGTDKGKIKLSNLDFTDKVTFTIKEKKAPDGYQLDDTERKFAVQRNKTTGKVELDTTSLVNITSSQINLNNGDGPVSVTINNTLVPDTFNFKLIKIDAKTGAKLPGAKFDLKFITSDGEVIKNIETELDGTKTISGLEGIGNIDIIIDEVKAPDGYVYIEPLHTTAESRKIKINRTSDGTLTVVNDAGYVVKVDNTNGTISVTLPNYRDFDLALRKFITEVNNVNVPSREPKVNVNSTGEITYTHTKQPIIVEQDDIITYKIRVYNEGNIPGYAQEIRDNIPEGLEFVEPTPGSINEKYGWEPSNDGKYITTDYLSREKGTALNGGTLENTNEIKAFDFSKYVSTDSSTYPSYREVEVQFRVTEANASKNILTNIAEISKDFNRFGDIPDIDSTPGEGAYIFDSNDRFNPNPVGNEDDIDVDNVKLQEFDLALRKFIKAKNPTVTNIVSGLDGLVTPSREPIPDFSKLVTGGNIVYNHDKTPVLVKNGDIVIYTIRIYNEGQIAGYAEEVKDILPDGLTYIAEHPINQQYRWKLDADGKTLRTDYLSKAVGEAENPERDNLINAFNSTNNTLDYKDVYVACLVQETKTSLPVLINTAEISDDADKDGNEVNDKDSTPNNGVSEEDDIDIEKLVLQVFDLALRKFITGVNEAKITDREPVPDVDENGIVTKYNHKKDPVEVMSGDIVIYTIRVYNEGKIDGYAEEIKDNIPAGLEFLPEHETNKKYNWIISEDRKTITTNYLSKESGNTSDPIRDNLIRAFDYPTMAKPEYRDVEVAFRAIEPDTSDRIIINIAEIKKDKNDQDIPDIDSIPDNNKEDEDDLDKEYLKLGYFDLALKKWVTKSIVTVDGKTTTTESGHTGDENPEPPVKVDLKDAKLSSTTVKFAYKIKVTNEGTIPGYAKEVKDYIPEGLKFIAADNPKWKEEGTNIVVTDELKDKLLNPGESATVEIILTWINSDKNLGLKVNWAEISKDYNDKGMKDIDSTPNNRKEGEDDIDLAPVMLTIKTGQETIYFTLTGVCLSMLGISIYLIKRKVL